MLNISRNGVFVTSSCVRFNKSKGELSKAALETLAIIIYRGLVTKSEIDYIRGVNSQFMLRSLLVRGLITRETHPKDKRRVLYAPTHDTLAHIGVLEQNALPQYEEYTRAIDGILQNREKSSDDSSNDIDNSDNVSL